jgi:hypothetical protein
MVVGKKAGKQRKNIKRAVGVELKWRATTHEIGNESIPTRQIIYPLIFGEAATV